MAAVELHNAEWRKSTRSSGGGNGDCVEVADLTDAIGVRDSKDPSGAILTPQRPATDLVAAPSRASR
jgi:hypothetical protein